MTNQIRTFLRGISLWPITEWNVFDITHSTIAPTKNEKRKIKQAIFSEVGDVSGVYAYTNSTGRILYVGKAKRLADRIFSHYTEAFDIVEDSNKGAAAWPLFFGKHAGGLKVHWIEMQGERERRILEEMVECIDPSEFDKEYPRGHRKSNASLALLKRL